MKKIIALLLAMAMATSLVACSNEDKSSSSESSESQVSSQDESSEESSEESKEESSEESSEESKEESGEVSTDVSLDGDLNLVFDAIFANADIDDEFQEMLTLYTQKGEIFPDNQAYFLGADDYEFETAVACEPMMSSQAISFSLIRANSEEEAQAIAERLPTTVDPIKWVCVSVEPEDVQTVVCGNVVFLIMCDQSEKFVESFESLFLN